MDRPSATLQGAFIGFLDAARVTVHERRSEMLRPIRKLALAIAPLAVLAATAAPWIRW
jgi:hypothetical protein